MPPWRRWSRIPSDAIRVFPALLPEFGDCGTGRVNIHFHADSKITAVAQLPVIYRYAP